MRKKGKASRKRSSTRRESGVDGSNNSIFGSPLRSKISSLNGRLVGYPDRLRTILKWEDKYTLNSTAGSTANQVFRGNSPFDPDFTGVFGNSATYFGNLSAVYGQYVVLGSRLSIVGTSTGSAGSDVCIWASDQNLGPKTFQQQCASKRSKVFSFGSVTGSSQPYPVPLELEFSSEEMQGQKEIESDPGQYSLVSANPGDPWYYGISMTSVDGATATGLYFKATIEFDVVFKELIGYAV